MKASFVLIIGLLACFSGYGQVEQDSTQKKIVKITKHNDIEYVGEILSDDGREVLIVTEELGKIYIPKSEIKSIREVKPEEVIKGNFREVGPFTTRYYFTNNALPIKKGEDYAMVHLYGPEVHFALTDRFSLGVMATWIASPIGLAAKYSIPTKNEKLNFALGTIMFNSGYLFQAQGWGGLHWANMTYGEAGKNVNFSAGYGYADLGFNDQHMYETGWGRMKHGPVISLGGIAPVGRKASFIFDAMIALTEHRNYQNVYIDYANGQGHETFNLVESGNKVSILLMPGMRFQKRDDRAFQIALAGVFEYSEVGFRFGSEKQIRSFPVPMCAWLFKF